MTCQRIVTMLALGAALGSFTALPAFAEDELGKPVPIPPPAEAPVAAPAPPPAADPLAAAAAAAPAPAPEVAAPPPPPPVAAPVTAAAKPAAKGALKPAKLSKEDLDLWAFSAVGALAPGKTLADFRALPNLVNEVKDELRGSDDTSTPATGPFGYRFTFSDGLTVRVMDYGASAFVTSLRLTGGNRPLPNELKLGMSRAQVEAILGRPTRGGLSYAVYEGKSDVIRTFYGEGGVLNKVEVDRGD